MSVVPEPALGVGDLAREPSLDLGAARLCGPDGHLVAPGIEPALPHQRPPSTASRGCPTWSHSTTATPLSPSRSATGSNPRNAYVRTATGSLAAGPGPRPHAAPAPRAGARPGRRPPAQTLDSNPTVQPWVVTATSRILLGESSTIDLRTLPIRLRLSDGSHQIVRCDVVLIRDIARGEASRQ